ncbi:hypothetical protein HK100_007424 [Physocladia obscura]|uniref:DH domain-containing protein n=1 Tax=Physocladia obscura TaxID=109957 RepID=A0AAD5XHB1_9FUNG|nr:hypothetical protein HK100_007424 [Physocladia obscura]
MPLKLAVQKNHVKIMKILLNDSRVDPAGQANWYIQKACELGLLEIVRLFLQHSNTGPYPRVSVSNRPSLQPSSKPLFQRCIDLVANLCSFSYFKSLLFANDIQEYPISNLKNSYLPTVADPLELLWHLFKLGAPLCVLYNKLAEINSGRLLQHGDISGITSDEYPKIPCKDNLYKFLSACIEMNIPLAQEIGGISVLYKDNIAGFMKFLSLVEDIVDQIKLANNIPDPNKVQFTTEESKDILNPLYSQSRILKEMIKTERTYVFSLEQLKIYANDLRASFLFDENMTTTLLSNLDELLDFQRRFIENAFAVYFEFCKNYQKASDVLRSQTLKLLDLIIKPCEIQSYLIKPLQRLINYPTFLEQLIDATESKLYPYKNELEEALQSIKRITKELSEIFRKEENMLIKKFLTKKMHGWKVL